MLQAGVLSQNRNLILALIAGHDRKDAVGQRPLQLQRLLRRRRHPGLNLLRFREDDRHGLRMNRPDHIIRLGRQEAEEVVRGHALLDLPHQGLAHLIPPATKFERSVWRKALSLHRERVARAS
jgi:hypothetical protein